MDKLYLTEDELKTLNDKTTDKLEDCFEDKKCITTHHNALFLVVINQIDP